MKETDETSIADAAKEVAALERKCNGLRKESDTARLAYGVALKELREARGALELKVAGLVERS